MAFHKIPFSRLTRLIGLLLVGFSTVLSTASDSQAATVTLRYRLGDIALMNSAVYEENPWEQPLDPGERQAFLETFHPNRGLLAFANRPEWYSIRLTTDHLASAARDEGWIESDCLTEIGDYNLCPSGSFEGSLDMQSLFMIPRGPTMDYLAFVFYPPGSGQAGAGNHFRRNDTMYGQQWFRGRMVWHEDWQMMLSFRDVQVVPVPLPTSAGLLVAGLAGLGVARRRKRGETGN